MRHWLLFAVDNVIEFPRSRRDLWCTAFEWQCVCYDTTGVYYCHNISVKLLYFKHGMCFWLWPNEFHALYFTRLSGKVHISHHYTCHMWPQLSCNASSDVIIKRMCCNSPLKSSVSIDGIQSCKLTSQDPRCSETAQYEQQCGHENPPHPFHAG